MRSFNLLSVCTVVLFSGLVSNAATAAVAIAQPVAQSDASSITLKFSYIGSRTPSYLRYYIDTDKNKRTGFPVKGIGSDKLVENGIVYKYTGRRGSWSWAVIGNVSAQIKSGGISSVSIPKALLGISSGFSFVANQSGPETYSSIVMVSASPSVEPVPVPSSAPPVVVVPSPIPSPSASPLPPVVVVPSPIPSPSASPLPPVVVVPSPVPSASPSPVVVVPSPTPSPVVVVPPPVGSTSTLVPAMNNAYVPNPAKGFYNYEKAKTLSASTLNGIVNSGDRMVIYILGDDLKQFGEGPISSAYLAQLQASASAMAAAGVKGIFRPAYDTDGAASPEPSLSTVLGHVQQLGAFVTANAGVFPLTEMGFIGRWGEDHGSRFNEAERNQIRLAWFNATPSSHFVSFRTLERMNEFFGIKADGTVTRNAQHFSRAGHYHHAFLNGSTSQTNSNGEDGTYGNVAHISDDRAWIARDVATHSKFHSFETNANEAGASCVNALAVSKRLGSAMGNRDYYPAAIARWQSEGCFEQMRSNMGYNLYVEKIVYPNEVVKGSSMSVQFVIKNRGNAAVAERNRPVEAILINEATGAEHVFNLNLDPTSWKAGLSHTINSQIQLPSSVPVGNYRIALRLKDASPALQNNPKFSIQLTNQDTWNATKGYNVYDVNIKIVP